MGVRVYTLVMPITSTQHYVLGSSTRVVIDCSKLFDSHGVAQSENDVTNLLAWVSSCPQRSNIHVVLGGYRNNLGSRKLHSRLQALGCTVIARHNARKGR